MEEVIACRNDTPDNLLFVAGGGAWVDKSSIMWRIFMKEAKALGLSFSTVDGIHKEKRGGELYITPPSRQQEVISEAIGNTAPGSTTLIITQCLGTVASLAALEQSPSGDRQVCLIAIAPPLPSPKSTLSTEKSCAKRSMRYGQAVMQVCEIGPQMNFQPNNLRYQTAIVPSAYLKEHFEITDMIGRLSNQIALGRAAICLPLGDWNTASVATAREWREGVLRLDDTGHSLNHVNGRQLPPDKALQFQRENVKTVLAFGRRLVGRVRQ